MKKKMKTKEESQQADKNTAEQLNPNNDKYWQARGFNTRPENWEELIKEKKS